MKITNIQQRSDGLIREIFCDVYFEQENVTERVFFQLKDTGRQSANPADSLFLCMLLPAMAFDEELMLDAPVSSDVVQNALVNIVPLMRRWFPRFHKPPRLNVEQTAPIKIVSEGKRGVYFSGGIDSFHSLLAMRDEIDSLVHIRGFEMDLENEQLWKSAHGSVCRVAEKFNKNVCPVTTNVLLVVKKHLDNNKKLNWPYFHIKTWFGVMLCAVGMLLRPDYSAMIIPASYTDGRERVASHPLIEPALTIESIEFVLEGRQKNRIEKLDYIFKEFPEFVQDFRVCTDTEYLPQRGKLNCGRCIKCTRANVELQVCGVPNVASLFSEQLRLFHLACDKVRGDRQIWQLVADEAQKRGEKEIYRVLSIMLNQPYLHRKLRALSLRFGLYG